MLTLRLTRRGRQQLLREPALSERVAIAYGEKIVELRGAMQQALNALNDGKSSREHNEARARQILSRALDTKWMVPRG